MYIKVPFYQQWWEKHVMALMATCLEPNLFSGFANYVEGFGTLPRHRSDAIKRWAPKNPKYFRGPFHIPSRGLTYPTLGKGKSSSNMPFLGGYVSFLEGLSKNRGTPKSSILIGISIINHPFLGYPLQG